MPSNTTIDGGTWDYISNDVTGVTSAATGETPIVFITFDNITGWDFTGAAELRSTNPRTVSLTADQATQLGVTDGQLIGNITYNVVVQPVFVTLQLSPDAISTTGRLIYTIDGGARQVVNVNDANDFVISVEDTSTVFTDTSFNQHLH